jgi:hypothetical protein
MLILIFLSQKFREKNLYHLLFSISWKIQKFKETLLTELFSKYTVMFKSILCFFKRNKKIQVVVTHTLLFKEQFKYFKTTHAYHLVDPSPCL